ncbi:MULTISPECIES: thiamine phosphate synthase [Brucella]|uniref:Thiamine-phosphate synthase n=1 Tax=Ochrobactrum soli TaxID=2448455 RepID=A0A2P9HKM8_9HYPH|nr:MULTISPECIES: thiamine phosphate synthase [Brucella]RRD27929.1 thiamine phosphate synthase [Brucellaceae bacterium VT-16-1752]WHT41217.1 thiamine phosphate synthase [Ochrobactrum sp. SSR]MDX4073487.1 thiamine phosphate synthase [Brucella sp. NBRC 113783]WHS32296.1 thiamine phosphate synthase [Brucella sp. NM4]SPL64350.1 Thiamin-phosphate pyrophosphorylase [[Ochrobactrum] soli]
MALDPFYPIFDSAKWLERMVPLGVKLVQLRVKDKTEAELRSEIRAAREICLAHDCQLIVNDYWKLALEEGCDFIHLGQEDLDDADLDAIRAGGLKLGVSSHDEAELDRALSVKPDYIALGPIYPTILKKMKWREQGLPRLGQWKARIGDIPLVGIGGMSVERAPGVFDAGADIVSVVTDITLNADPESRLRQWIETTRAYADHALEQTL